MTPAPFKIAIPDAELELLQRKIQDARLPNLTGKEEWAEPNGVTVELIASTVNYWKNKYSWRDVESKLNSILPQYTTPIETSDFGTVNIHFVHSPSAVTDAIPMLFLHGWPGSFIEVQKVLPMFNKAGFNVVAPSLPGYGFSSYPSKAGWKLTHTAGVMHQLMQELGYKEYVVQGGDWGSAVARAVAIGFPEQAKLLHTNMLLAVAKPESLKDKPEPQYSPEELALFKRGEEFVASGNSAYQLIQSAKPRTLGFALHDSPVGMLAWMTDKLFMWSDAYPWTSEELITWTLMHYWPGPTTGLVMYRENDIASMRKAAAEGKAPKLYVKQPTGVSVFPRELGMVPRLWGEQENNIVFWQHHKRGGHFAAWEQPDELAADVIAFFKEHWSK